MRSHGLRAWVHARILAVLVRLSRLVDYRGLYRVTNALRRVFGDTEVVVDLRHGRRMVLPLGDGYWAPLLDRRYRYEPEVEIALDALVTPDAYFLDCGANAGYWSLLYQDRARSVVAVEASPATYARLEDNVHLNGDRVELVHAALWSVDGKPLTMRSHRDEHAASSLAETDVELSASDGWTDTDVESVTLATLVRKHCPDPDAPVVVKLDVEGAEIPTFEGAGPVLGERDVTVVYEDHGADATHKVSRHVLEMGMGIFDPATGAPLTLEGVAALKTDTVHGFNFLARYAAAP
jgi:FkbM family methyltransferase